MGAGRKTETYKQEDVQNLYGTMSVRKLQKGDLCGVIFGCKFSTIKECLSKNLFGLPGPHMAYIKNIEPGLTLFLFNYSDRTLHGVFEAASEGKLNIDPNAWSHNGTDPSPYPAQVKVRVRVKCEPLVEETFGPVIADNYKDEKIFWFELDRIQTNKLLRLFKPSPIVRAPPPSTSKYAVASSSRKAIPAASLVEIGDSGGAPRVDKWSSLFKSSENKGQDSSKDGVVVNLGKAKECEEVAQKPVSWSGPSYSSVLRNAISTESSARHEPSSKASEGVVSSRQAEDVVVNNNTWDQQSFQPAHNGTSAAAKNVTEPSKGKSVQDTYSEIDWDAAPNFQAHLKGLNMILEDKDRYSEGNTGFASSSMMENHWEDERVSWEYEEENNIDKSSCGGSSYFTAMSGDAFEDDGEEKEKLCMDVLSEIWAEVKEMKQTQMKQAEYMISLQMELLESRKEILRLKGLYGSS
ncbi:hypothetical protein HA466_0022360 [Hirschfeldia incana]|nr:hypothetical protein HA466_0022360 [Hirschfeldia incana]